MDGTRDRPPGKAAENWSRKDGIRAGSVSGPWRSAPREAEAPRKAAVGPAPREPAGHPYAHKPGEPMRAQRATLYGAGSARGHGHRAAMMVLWIAFGAMAAIAAVILAFLFRPELGPGGDAVPDVAGIVEPAPAVPDGTAAPAVEGPAAAPASAAGEPRADEPTRQAAGDAALSAVSDLRLRIGPEFPDARRQAILAALEAAGVAGVQVEQLPFRIATSRVGYYRAEDLPLAEALVRVVAPVLDGEVGVRDYGRLLSDAEPGRLDLWVGG